MTARLSDRRAVLFAPTPRCNPGDPVGR